MRLSDWVQQQGWGELTRLRKATGKSYATLHALYKRQRAASAATGKLIEAATDGHVTSDEVTAELTSAERRRLARKRKVHRRGDLRCARPSKESA